MHPALSLGIAYIAGSIPSAYIAGRLLKDVDLRTVGSGNLGATNVFRVLGVVPGVIVLLADAAKGVLPVAFLPNVLPGAPLDEHVRLWWALAFGLFAIAGHTRSPFLLWKGGGKGVATAAGVFAALAPTALAVSIVVFVLVLWRSGMVSLASLSSAIALPVVVGITMGVTSPVALVGGMVGMFIVWTHRTNIARLRRGTEPRILQRPRGGA